MTCAICLGDIQDNVRANTKCGHSFHTKCLLENLAIGKQGFKCPMCRTVMCSDINERFKKDHELLIDHSEILEDNIATLESELEDHCDWVLYLYDQADEYIGKSMKGQSHIKHLKKKIKKLEYNLKKSQSNLSKTLYDPTLQQSNKKRTVKCSRCNCLGHNAKTCQNRFNEPYFPAIVSKHIYVHDFF